MKIRVVLVLASFLGLKNLLLAEQTTRLGEVQVVTSASGYEQKLTDAPASISVITQEDLQKKPYTNLLDAVADIEGVDIGETNDKTNSGQISIRGMGADYTLVLIDGKRQNNNGDLYPNSFGGVQYSSIPPLSMIERIEVIRGPMSTLYGSDAIGGVVNIITKKISKEWTGTVGYSKTFQQDNDYGNDDNVDFSIMGPIIKDRLGLSLRGSFYEQDRSNPEYKKLYHNGVDVSKSNDSFGAGKGNVENEKWTFGAGLTFTPNENHTIRADFDISKQKFDNKPYLASDGSMVYPLGTGDSYETIYKNQRVGYSDTLRMQREQYSLFWEADWALGKSTVGAHHIKSENLGRSMPLSADERAYVTANKGSSWSNLSDAMNDPYFVALLSRPDRTLESKNTTYSAKYELPISNHFLVVGAEYQDSEVVDGVFGMEKGESNVAKEYYQYAIYAEDSWNIIDSLTLTFGARYNKHEDFGDYTTPRAYLTYSLNDNWTFKGGVSTGYKTPKATDLYEGITGFGGQGTMPWMGNPDLKPEKSVNTEIAAYYEHPNGHNFNVTLFQNNFKDKIESITVDDNQLPSEWQGIATSFSQKQNVRKAEIRGVEVAGKYFILENLSIKANWTYMDSQIDSNDKATDGIPLGSSPEHMYSATIDWQATSSLSAYIQYKGEVDRFKQRYKNSNGKYKDLYYKDYSIWNLGVSYKFNKDFTVTSRINNLFDKDYLDYNLREVVGTTKYYNEYNNKTSGRNFWLSARYTF